MKRILVLLGASFFAGLLVSCAGDEGNFTTTKDSDSQFIQELQSIHVEEEKEINNKIGRGKKKGRDFNVAETVGKKDLGKLVANVKIIMTENSKPVVIGDKVDILFYTTVFNGVCHRRLTESLKNGFLKNLKGVDWQIGLSVFSDEGDAQLVEWERNSRRAAIYGKGYGATSILKKSVHDNKVGNEALKSSLEHETWTNKSENNDPGYDATSKIKRNTVNMITGLDRLLSVTVKDQGLFRKHSKAHVFILGKSFPYLTYEEWKAFFKKHENVKLHFLSSRNTNVSNIHHAITEQKNLDWTPLCDDPSNFDSELADLVLN